MSYSTRYSVGREISKQHPSDVCLRHPIVKWDIGWLPVGLENLDSYLNVKYLKLRKLQVSDSKPERLLQIKVNLEMVFVYRPRACIANFNMHVQQAKFYF